RRACVSTGLVSMRQPSYLWWGMAALAERDAEGGLRFLALAGGVGGGAPFPPAVLAELGKLIRADWVTYCEQDRIRRRPLRGVGRPGELWGDGGVGISYWRVS